MEGEGLARVADMSFLIGEGEGEGEGEGDGWMEMYIHSLSVHNHRRVTRVCSEYLPPSPKTAITLSFRFARDKVEEEEGEEGRKEGRMEMREDHS